MSVLDGWFDVCRSGIWRDTAGLAVSLDKDRLDRIVAAHASADPPRVVIGQPHGDAPAAIARVNGLRRSGDRLQATLHDFEPAFRRAVEAGRYGGLSIALQGDRLLCIGFVEAGEAAAPLPVPARPGAEPCTVIACAGAALPGTARDRSDWLVVAETMRRLHEQDGTAGGPRRPVAAVPDGRSDTGAAVAGRRPAGTAGAPPLQPPPNPELLVLGDAPPEFGREPAAAPDGAAAIAAAFRRYRIQEVIDGHVRAGRILASERNRLTALLASLPDNDGDAIAYAAPDGSGREIRETPASILERFLAMLPRRFDFVPAEALPVPKETGGDIAAVTEEARALMAERAGKGIIVSHGWAREQVRARRGLPKI